MQAIDMAKPYLHCRHRFKNGKDHCYYGPISMSNSPAWTSRSTPRRAEVPVLPSAYVLVSWRTAIAGCIWSFTSPFLFLGSSGYPLNTMAGSMCVTLLMETSAAPTHIASVRKNIPTAIGIGITVETPTTR